MTTKENYGEALTRAYEEAKTQAWETYQEIESPLVKAYQEDQDSNAYQLVAAPAWLDYLETCTQAYDSYIEDAGQAWEALVRRARQRNATETRA